MTTLPTWAIVLHSGRIIAIGAADEDHARAVYGYIEDVRTVEPYDPLRHLFGRDLDEWKELTGYTEPEPEIIATPDGPIRMEATIHDG
jgi:hypothetical protein